MVPNRSLNGNHASSQGSECTWPTPLPPSRICLKTDEDFCKTWPPFFANPVKELIFLSPSSPFHGNQGWGDDSKRGIARLRWSHAIVCAEKSFGWLWPFWTGLPPLTFGAWQREEKEGGQFVFLFWQLSRQTASWKKKIAAYGVNGAALSLQITLDYCHFKLTQQWKSH